MSKTESENRPRHSFTFKDFLVASGFFIGAGAGLALILDLHSLDSLEREIKIGQDTIVTKRWAAGGVHEVYLNRPDPNTGKTSRVFDIINSTETDSKRIFIIKTSDSSSTQEALDYIKGKCGGVTAQLENFVELPDSECLG